MKVLESVHTRLIAELPHCKSHNEVEVLLDQAVTMLQESKAPLGEKRRMWEEIKENLSNMIRRPDIVNDARNIIDRHLKNMV
jgi:hypothetical protein